MADKQSEMKAILLKMKEDAFEEISKAIKSGANAVTGEPSGDIYDQASSERDRELGLLLNDREREKVTAGRMRVVGQKSETAPDSAYASPESAGSPGSPRPATRICS